MFFEKSGLARDVLAKVGRRLDREDAHAREWMWRGLL